ncbi:ankyrin repeat domain-containing protein [Stenotrophomonas maltophilia]|uniref:ankyrin repeat domain-containing protein n=1 Tax=Stenotrophomonas maltophilia TaxID=40324 RepID=UPI0039C36B19
MAGNVFSNLLRPFIRQKDTELPGVASSEPLEPPVRERLDDSSQRPVASAEPATLSPVEGPQSVPPSFNDEATDRLGNTLAFAGLKTKGRFEHEVRQAIEDGADVKGYRDARGDSALHKCQEPWQMELLISAGADVHALDKQGRLPFDRLLSTYQREPAWSEKPTAEGLALLAKAGADVNALSQGQSALHVAAKRGLEGDCHMLIDAGADVNLRTDGGDTPLHLASDPSVVLRLLDAKADPSLLNSNGEPALKHDPMLYRESIRNHRDDFSPRERVDAATDPIFLAETPSELVAALGQGGSVRDTDALGRTALHYVKTGEMVQALVLAGAQVDAKDMEGNIPAHTADERAMKELVDGVGRGVPQHHVENDRGETPYATRDYYHEDRYWDAEAEEQAAEKAEETKEEQDRVLNIVALVEAGDAKRLLEQVDPNEELVSRNRTFNIDGDEGWAYNNYAGYSVLHEAAKQGKTELCRELVFAGADWDKGCKLVGEQGFDNHVNGFRNEPRMKPIDFASNRETKAFLNNAENELRAHNRSKLLDELLPAANAWKPPEGGFAADAQRQVGAAMKAHGQDGQAQEAPRLRARF